MKIIRIESQISLFFSTSFNKGEKNTLAEKVIAKSEVGFTTQGQVTLPDNPLIDSPWLEFRSPSNEFVVRLSERRIDAFAGSIDGAGVDNDALLKLVISLASVDPKKTSVMRVGYVSRFIVEDPSEAKEIVGKFFGEEVNLGFGARSAQISSVRNKLDKDFNVRIEVGDIKYQKLGRDESDGASLSLDVNTLTDEDIEVQIPDLKKFIEDMLTVFTIGDLSKEFNIDVRE